jgi:hypothetical protein
LLLSIPDDPATQSDTAPGGIESNGTQRRKWLHPPERELEILKEKIAERAEAGFSTKWHRGRAATLEALLETRKPKTKAPVRVLAKARKR